MTKPKEVFKVVEVPTKKPYRLYVDNVWIDDYETEPEALNALTKWIANNGRDILAEGLQYVFDEVYVSKIVKTKRVVRQKPK
ncbi:hypothetical protein KAW18_02225 [candidate division WOR-3 bacterium]|nr:hypothetical protein [candidate division WOR-3 bacterium]